MSLEVNVERVCKEVGDANERPCIRPFPGSYASYGSSLPVLSRSFPSVPSFLGHLTLPHPTCVHAWLYTHPFTSLSLNVPRWLPAETIILGAENCWDLQGFLGAKLYN